MFARIVARLVGWYGFRTDKDNYTDFLNRLNNENIPFWGARVKDGYGYVRISLFDYSRTVKVADGIAENVKQVGLPFIIYKYRKRIGLAIGTFLGLMLMFVSSLFVWDVRVTGNVTVSDAKILNALSQIGVRTGTFIPSIYAPKAGTELILSMPELSSAFVNIDGTTVTVDVIERRSKPEIHDFDGNCDIAAGEDGVIVSVEAYSGKPVVSHGDIVMKGQILISGVYLYGAETEINTNARGVVLAETKKTFVYTVPLSLSYREYTGRTDIKTSYSILGRNYDMFYGPPSNFENFEAEIVSKKLSLFFLSLPITKTKLSLREYRTVFVDISLDEAKKRAETAFDSWCVNDTDGEIITKDAKFVYDRAANAVTIVGRVTVVTDIAEPVERRTETEEEQ